MCRSSHGARTLSYGAPSRRPAGVGESRGGSLDGSRDRRSTARRRRREPALTTVASLARDWARRAPHQVAMREKDFGIWQEYTWDARGTSSSTPPTACWPSASSPATGCRSTPRTGPSGSSSTSPPSPCAASPSASTRPTRRPRSSTCSATAAPSVHLAEDQEQVDKVLDVDRSRARRPAHDHLRRAARPAGLRRRPADVVGGLPRPRARAPRRPTPARSSERMAARRARRRDDARLHVGHDRAAQGRDAHQRQRRVLDRARSSTLRDRLPGGKLPDARRPDRHLPPAVPHRRADLLDVAPRRRAAASSTSPSRSRRSPPTSARSSRRCSSPSPGSGRSSTPAS